MGAGASTPSKPPSTPGGDRSLTDAQLEALIALIAAATLEATPPLGAAAAIEEMIAQAWTRTADRELLGAQAARLACELARAAASRGVVGAGAADAGSGASMNEAQLRSLLAGTLDVGLRARFEASLAELRAREAATSVRGIADYVEARVASERVFHTQNHPATGVLLRVAGWFCV